MTGSLVLRHGRVLDVASGEYAEADVRIEDGSVVEVAAQIVATTDVEAVDLAGAFVLPGLIDCHVHVIAGTADLAELRTWSPTYSAYKTAETMSAMLDRGFTTVRDTAGADYGIAAAQADGLIRGPRVFFGGRALSQTGGHGDSRTPGEQAVDDHEFGLSLSRLADGVDAVRAAARDELRKGADHLKVMAGGGVASPTDRIDSTQYSDDELRAVVEEAEAANRYVAAHAYTARSINRALEAGIRTIEHGNLLDDTSIPLFLAKQAFLVMNLVTYWALQEEGREHGLSEGSWRKVDEVLEGGRAALESAWRGGVPIAYGTDLLGGMQRHQSREFAIRAEVQPALEVIRSATTTAASLLRQDDRVGVVAPGAYGDLIVLDRDPLADVTVLAEPERFAYVVQGGVVVRRG